MKLHVPEIPIAMAALELSAAGTPARILDANEAYVRLWGLPSRAAAIGTMAEPSWPSAWPQRTDAAPTHRQIVPRQHADGSVHEIEVTASLQFCHEGNASHVLLTCIDLTARADLERALRDSERRFRNLAVNTPGAIWRYTLHPDGRDAITYLSPGCVEIWEVGPEQVAHDATPLWQQIDARDVDAVRASVHESAATLRPWLAEFRITTPSGKRKWLQGAGRPERLADGVVGWDSLILDITALRSAEAERRLSDARLSSVFAESPAGLAIFDRAGRYTHVNPVLARMNGASVERHLGRHPRDLLPAELAASIEASVQAILITGKPATNLEFAGETPADPGMVHHWLTSMFPIIDEHGMVEGAGVVVVETTAQKQAEAARLQLETRLLQAQRLESIGRLAGGIAHDFNNLLTVILANAEEAWQAAPTDAPIRERLREITTAARSSAELTRQLLAVARRQVVSPQVLAVDAEVQRMLELLRRLIGEHAELAWAPGAADGNVEIDSGQLSQILTNLVVNARDASPRGSRIDIATATVDLDARLAAQCPPGRYVRISVRDRGSGMDAATLARIFEPFFTTKAVGRGTGLGLATVHGIVMQNRGGIDVRSTPGHGTTIDVYLPHHRGPLPMAPATATAELPAPAGGTVLLVEDEPPILALASRFLQNLGCTVHATTSAREALTLAAHAGIDFDLLVTDLVMPEMSGKELAERLLATRPGLKVLFLSGYFPDADAPGLHGTFLGKPFTAAEFEAKVREVFAR